MNLKTRFLRENKTDSFGSAILGASSSPVPATNGRRRTGRRLRQFIFPLCLLVIGLLWTACVTTIVPPHAPRNPTTVCLVDYGRHASLVLPNNGAAVEYEYGEWKWFALGQTQSWRFASVLFWPTQGTLARRHLPHPPEPARWQHVAQEVLSIEVSSNDVARLREKLLARYEANLHSEIFNREYQLAFVKDPANYTAFHNCNHELAGWLKELGCTIRGRAIFARFKLARPEP
jgi:hypothetical protein